MRNKNSGITLVALIVTIVLMLIIAGVAIFLAFRDDGILKMAQNASETTKQKMAEERLIELVAEYQTDKYVPNSKSSLEGFLNEREYKTSSSNGRTTVVVDGYIFEVDEETYAIEKKEIMIGEDETPKYIGGQYNEEKGINTPKIVNGLIPVTINEDGTPEVVLNPNTDDWYSYKPDDKRWANAITRDSSGEITGYFVWIPRYGYAITSGYHEGGAEAGNINIKFLKDKTNETSDEMILEDNTIGFNNWNIHPAFASDVTKGGWDKELEGFWVAKFPAGYAGGNNGVKAVSSGITYSTVTGSKNFYGKVNEKTEMVYPVFLPETYAYNYISIGDSFELAQNLTKNGNIYGLLGNANSHQMKNSEWGAVAYLTQSEYGINENLYINNISLHNSPDTIYAITGWVGEGTDSRSNGATVKSLNDRTENSANIWYSNKGQNGSSTGNVYGIYDLSGCVWERVSGYILNDAGQANRTNYGETLVIEHSDKLVTVYNYDVSDTQIANYEANDERYGDAMYETSSKGRDTNTYAWYSDSADFPYLNIPFIIRGGNYTSKSEAGIFAFDCTVGYGATTYGFRAVLCPE